METQRAVTRPRSTVVYRSGMVAAVLFLVISQIILSIIIPSSGAVPPQSLVVTGGTMTFLAVVSTMVMVYGMLLRRRGE